MDTDYKYKSFSEEDVHLMPPLYKSAFGLEIKPSYVKSKFFHPYQKIKSSRLAIYKDRIAASFYGIITMQAELNGEKFYIGQSCDSMTHKDHGGKKLFVNLAEQVYDDIKKKGIEYIFGFPNETIYNLRVKKLSWQHQENINVYKQKIKTFPLAKVVKKLPLFKSIYNTYISFVFKKWKSTKVFFRNSVVRENVAGIVHDEAYFDYKKTPDKFILNIGGTNFWVKIDGFFWVGDFEPLPNDDFTEKYNTLKRLAVLTGCTSIVFHYQENTVNDILLKKLFPVAMQMPMGFIYLNKEFDVKTFKFAGADFDSW